MTKPVIGYVAGLTAPRGRRMGHAGALISAFGDTAAEKAEIMRSAGLVLAPSPAELGSTVAAALARKPSPPVIVRQLARQADPPPSQQSRSRRPPRNSCLQSSKHACTRTPTRL